MMLKLIREDGEEIFINKGQIRVKVIRTESGRVLLGIHAPREIDILRRELFLCENREKM